MRAPTYRVSGVDKRVLLMFLQKGRRSSVITNTCCPAQRAISRALGMGVSPIPLRRLL